LCTLDLESNVSYIQKYYIDDEISVVVKHIVQHNTINFVVFLLLVTYFVFVIFPRVAARGTLVW